MSSAQTRHVDPWRATEVGLDVRVPIRSLVAFVAYMQFGLDLRPDDVFWNIADRGWAYGLYYALLGPLLMGHQTTLYDGPFTVDGTLGLVRELGVTNFAAAPTAYRMIIAAGKERAEPLADNLRVASSAAKPLNPELMKWFAENVGCNLLDHYGQTEIGMALVNHHGLDHEVRPGSAGFAMPGFELVVVDEGGRPVPPASPGLLAVHRERSPLFSCLIEHEAVAESAVVGKPDEQRGQIVAAFVVLRPGYPGGQALSEELTPHVRTRLGKHAYPDRSRSWNRCRRRPAARSNASCCGSVVPGPRHRARSGPQSGQTTKNWYVNLVTGTPSLAPLSGITTVARPESLARNS